MELNEEQIEKALDWLDSLVGNSNDSDIALLTYQLLGILYDTCEELTEKNAIQIIAAIELDKQVQRLTEENERLQKALNTDISIVRVVSRGSGKTAHLREVGRIKADAIRANTVRKMQEALLEELYKVARCRHGDEYNMKSPEVFRVVDQIAKEMLEDNHND